MSNKISNYFKQDGTNLFCIQSCKIIIDMSYYDIGDSILINEDSIWCKSLVSQVEFEDLIFNLILDYSVNLKIEHIIKHGKESIELIYNKGNLVLEVPSEVVDIKQQVSYVERLIGGKEITKDAPHLFKKLYAVYGPISDMDIVHMETLLSQCLRDRSNPSIPARLGRRWDPILVNIKKNIFSSGFLQGLGFENINQVIKSGLINDVDLEPSIIEKLMTGTLVEKKTEEY